MLRACEMVKNVFFGVLMNKEFGALRNWDEKMVENKDAIHSYANCLKVSVLQNTVTWVFTTLQYEILEFLEEE